MTGPITVPALSTEINAQLPSGEPGGLTALQLRGVLQDMNAQRGALVTPAMYDPNVGQGGDDSAALQAALNFIGTNAGVFDGGGLTYRYSTDLTLTPSAGNTITTIRNAKFIPSLSMTSPPFSFVGNAGRPSLLMMHDVVWDLTNGTGSPSAWPSCVSVKGAAATKIFDCCFVTDNTPGWAAGFACIAVGTLVPGDQNSNSFYTLIERVYMGPNSGGGSYPPYGIALTGEANATIVRDNVLTAITVGIGVLPDPVDGTLLNSIDIHDNFIEGGTTAVQLLGNPGAITISSGTYISGTGAVSLTLAASSGMATGSIFTLAVTGSGADIGLLTGFQAYTATAGTSGTTVHLTIATGKTITITGGTLSWYGFLPAGVHIHRNRAESLTNFLQIGSTGASKSNDQPVTYLPDLQDNYVASSVTNYASVPFGNLFYTNDIKGYDSAGFPNVRWVFNGAIPTLVLDDGVHSIVIDNPGDYLRFVDVGQGVLATLVGSGAGPQFATHQAILDSAVLTPQAIGSLPAASSEPGGRRTVNNAVQTVAANIGAILSGTGSNTIPVYSDGTNWRVG